MKKNYLELAEKYLKRCMKKKASVNRATVIAFLITGFFAFNLETFSATAIGNNVTTGTGATASGTDAIAIGNGATAIGDKDVSIGRMAGKIKAGITVGSSVYIGENAGMSSDGTAINETGKQRNGTNVYIGNGAGSSAKGTQNTYVGSTNAGGSAQGDLNSAFGMASMYRTIGSENAGFGAYSGQNSKGNYNTSIGTQAGRYVTGAGNTALGYDAGSNITANDTVSVGDLARATANNAVAIGGARAYRKTVNGTAETVIAPTTAYGQFTVAIGSGAGALNKIESGSTEYDKITNGTSSVENTFIGAASGIDVLGRNNTTLGSQSGQEVTGNRNSALGSGAGTSVKGNQNLALGALSGSNITGNNNVSIGANAGAGARPTTALNISETIAIGTNTKARANNAIVIGNTAEAKEELGVALGAYSLADRAAEEVGYDVATGAAKVIAADANNLTKATWQATAAAVSVGNLSDEDDLTTRQITGVAAGTEDTDAVNVAQLKTLNEKIEANKIGYFSVNSTEAGNKNNDGATGPNAIAIGPNATSKKESTIAIGKGAQAGSDLANEFNHSIAIGTDSKSIADDTIAIGREAKADSTNGIAIGRKTSTDGFGAISLGEESKSNSSISIGKKSESSRYSVAMGEEAKAFINSVAIGKGATGENGVGNVAVGYESSTKDKSNATAIGNNAKVEANNSVALGANSLAKVRDTRLGYDMSTNTNVDIASKLSDADKATYEAAKTAYTQSYDEYKAIETRVEELRAIPYDQRTDEQKTELTNLNQQMADKVTEVNEKGATVSAFEKVWKATRGEVAIGDAENNITRQITGVAAGTQDTDAVNVAQLKSTTLNFTGDNSTSGSVNLASQKFAITGDGNIVTKAEGQGISLSLSKEITDKIDNASTAANKEMYFHVNDGTGTQAAGTTSSNKGKVDELGGATGKYATAAGMNAGATAEKATAVGYNAKATQENAVALGNGAIAYTNNGVAIGNGANVSREGGSVKGGIAIGEGAYSHNMAGNHEAIVKFGRDANQVTGGIAIGQNTHSRVGNVEVGNRDYRGQIGDFDFKTEDGKVGGTAIANNGTLTNNNVTTGVGSTVVGDNSFAMGNFQSVNGSYNVISKAYDKSTASWAGDQITRGLNALHNAGAAIQGFGSTITGSLNSIEANESLSGNIGALFGGGDPANGLMYSGTASNIVGIGNRINKSNGSLIFGAGNEITNSYISPNSAIIMDSLSTNVPILGRVTLDPTLGNNSIKELSDTLRTYMQNNRLGSVGIMGGANKVDYAVFSSINGVGNTLEGTGGTALTSSNTTLRRATANNSIFSAFNSINGYENKGKNVSHTAITGSWNEVENATKNIVMGNNNVLKGTTADVASGNIIMGFNTTKDADDIKASAKNTISLGNDTKVGADNVVVLGTNAQATVENGVALGSSSVAKTDAGAVGYDMLTGAAHVIDPNATAADKAVWQATKAAVSVGDVDNNITRQITGVAAGTQDTDAVNVAQLKTLNEKVEANKIEYFSVNSIETGNKNNDGATGTNAIAIGNEATASGDSGLSVGRRATASGVSSTAIGIDSNAAGAGSVALGLGATARNTGFKDRSGKDVEDLSVAIGAKAETKHVQTVAIGAVSKAYGSSTVALGERAGSLYKVKEGSAEYKNYIENINSTKVAENTFIGSASGMDVLGRNNTAVGSQSGQEVRGSRNSALGSGAGTSVNGSQNVAVGVLSGSNLTGNNNISIGANAGAGARPTTPLNVNQTIAIGSATRASESNAIAIGNSAEATVASGIALGAYSLANTNAGQVGYDVSTGAAKVIDANANNLTKATWQATAAAVSVGNLSDDDDLTTRQITGVAAGTQDTDAVNVAQLKATTLNFTGDNSTSGSVNLASQKFAVTGDGNVVTKADEQGLSLSLSKNITDKIDNAATKDEVNQGRTKVTSDDGTVTIKPPKDGNNTYDLSVNTTKIAKNTNLTYKANGANSQTVSLANGLNFTNGTYTTATVGEDGKVVYDLNQTTIDKIDNANKGIADISNKGLTFKGDKAENPNLANGVTKKLDETVAITGDSNITTTTTANGVKVGLNKDLNLTDNGSVKIGDNGPSLTNKGLDNAGNKITNVAAGTADTDAVNVSQLKDLKNEINKTTAAAKTEVVGGNNVSVSESKGKDGQTVYTVNAEKSTVTSGSDAVVVKTQQDKGNNTTNYEVDLSQEYKDKINNAAAGSTVRETVKAGSKNVILTEGTNTTGGKEYTVDVAKNLDLGSTGSVKMGDTTVNNSGLTIENGPKVTTNGIDAGSKQIKNVAKGTADTDAVNVSQLRDYNQNINNNINNQINAVNNRIDDLDKSTRRGIAGAMAQAGVKFQEQGVNQVVVGAATSFYKGQGAVAVGVQGAPTENTRIHTTVSATPGRNTNAAVTVGGSWKFDIK